MEKELGYFIPVRRRIMEDKVMELWSSAERKEPDKRHHLKLQQEKFGLSDWKQMFTEKVVKH